MELDSPSGFEPPSHANIEYAPSCQTLFITSYTPLHPYLLHERDFRLLDPVFTNFMNENSTYKLTQNKLYPSALAFSSNKVLYNLPL